MSAKGRTKTNAKAVSIVIRKEEVVEAGHHGGAWKVAYADFVTAMMAFFLLMWLINATTEAQRKGLADYFSPQNALSHNSSGTGKPFGGSTPFDKGALVSSLGAVQVMVGNNPTSASAIQGRHGTPGKSPRRGTGPAHRAGQGNPGPGGIAGQKGAAAAAMLLPAAAGGATRHAQSPNDSALRAAAAQETKRLKQAAAAVRAAIMNDPHLRALAGQIAVDVTPQGLRIQLLDNAHRPMFALGSATPNPWTQSVLRKIAPILAKLSERISIAGYTDAAPYSGVGRTNWALSAARADGTRAILVAAQLPAARIWRVVGYADRDLLLPSQPLAAENRRVVIVVRRAVPTPAPGPAQSKPARTAQGQPAGGGRAPTPPARRIRAQTAPGDFVVVPGTGSASP